MLGALLLVGWPVRLVIVARNFEAHRLLGLGRCEVGMQLPEFFRDKFPDLPLPLHNQPNSD